MLNSAKLSPCHVRHDPPHCLADRLASGRRLFGDRHHELQQHACVWCARVSADGWHIAVWHRRTTIYLCVVLWLQFGRAQSRGWERRGGGRGAPHPPRRTQNRAQSVCDCGPDTVAQGWVSLSKRTPAVCGLLYYSLLSLSLSAYWFAQRLAPHALLAHFPLPCTRFFGFARRRAF